MSTVSLDEFQLRELINALNKISRSLEAIERELRQMRYKG
jgi:hypothetical protein